MSELVRVSDEMKQRLEEVRDDNGHSSIDSVIREWHAAWHHNRQAETTTA